MPVSIDQKVKFRAAIMPVLYRIEAEFGIKPFIGLAQAAHESNWGVSQLATEGFNLYGITPGDAWVALKAAGRGFEGLANWSSLGTPVVSFPTTEYSKLPPEKIRYWEIAGDVTGKRDDGNGGSVLTVERFFRAYANWEESCWDWARKIAKVPRYAAAYTFAQAGTLAMYADAVAHAGYGSDPKYAASLLAVGPEITALPA